MPVLCDWALTVGKPPPLAASLTCSGPAGVKPPVAASLTGCAEASRASADAVVR